MFRLLQAEIGVCRGYRVLAKLVGEMVAIVEGDGPSDRVVLRLDPVGPVEVSDLTTSFSALARLYDRHYRHGGEPAPKLYITKLETGSIIAEVAPYVMLLGTAVSSMDTAMIVSDFTKRLTKGIVAFSDPTNPDRGDEPSPSREDAADIREFVKPLAGRKGASLGIKHARYHSRDGEKEIVLEYVFDEAEINRATINISEILESDDLLIEADEKQLPSDTSNILSEVTLIFEQASRKPGRERGRTADKAVIADVSPKALPVYFRKSFRDLKDRMVRSDVNPLTNSVFVVDAHVTRIEGEPKAYVVTEVHAVLPIDEP